MTFHPLRRYAAIVAVLFFAAPVWSDEPDNPVREMLLARYGADQREYRAAFESIDWPAELGLGREELLQGLDNLQQALTSWPIRFQPGNAAFAVSATAHELSVNPLSVEDLLQQDADALLHESVHVTPSQEKRQQDALYAEYLFVSWLQDHVDDARLERAEAGRDRPLDIDELIDRKLWAGRLESQRAPLDALSRTLRESWICEIQAYYVQLSALNRSLKRAGGASLHHRVAGLQRMLLSESGFAGSSSTGGSLVDPGETGLRVFQAFDARRVTAEFRTAVLGCVLLNEHDARLFRALAEAHGWSMAKARRSPPYRRRLEAWAEASLLHWESLRTAPYTLNPRQLDELRRAHLL